MKHATNSERLQVWQLTAQLYWVVMQERREWALPQLQGQKDETEGGVLFGKEDVQAQKAESNVQRLSMLKVGGLISYPYLGTPFRTGSGGYGKGREKASKTSKTTTQVTKAMAATRAKVDPEDSVEVLQAGKVARPASLDVGGAGEKACPLCVNGPLPCVSAKTASQDGIPRQDGIPKGMVSPSSNCHVSPFKMVTSSMVRFHHFKW